MSEIRYEYRFNVDGLDELNSKYLFDSQTMIPIEQDHTAAPDWARLQYHQCPNCPLPTGTEYCPYAASLAPLVTQFSDVISHTPTSVHIEHNHRVFYKETDAQEALSSLFGLVGATSGCPHMEPFRPLARYHLPFSDDSETYYRLAANYRLAQYLREKEGLPSDSTLDGVLKIYAQVEIVNNSIAARLRSSTNKDSVMNSLIRLNIFAQMAELSLDEELEDNSDLYSAYLCEFPLWEQSKR